FVGPEGGYSPEELAAFARFKATGYRLGKLILRAETMPAAALTLIQQATGWRSASDP
ncbi:MAG: 16S rRNA (uracil(1498)-N(3))-methyltransferase, partial [Pseudomonadota bacterium]|nr:16S rRNA (uracil(1498)-N(3))-methyltransferase [Pseudomonadota bacterium]